MIILIKGALIYHLGQDSYSARIEAMLAGVAYEQAAAYVLMPDWASLRLSEVCTQLVNFMRQS
ncbi:hypothetical protein E2K80_04515 [Rhodophyticola sp. CCM32]|uniref:hypothetical protein n=1 Tax=Rhodophyticola sp. CCM32 TaxID=2916397 RepID=UPI00107F85D5|nr:hypothetical protein [Rhodophyticola sp. CCM32]QBY00094.1 hypothetical protein E2K80_04515 [Rhodophyticola sp. CCM32]